MKNNTSIGKKETFWGLLQDSKSIKIPTIQRDYIYGAETEKTDMVLNNMLETFKNAFDTGEEETLDFVYGSESRAKEFMPLDGQQRLTTLYLLHFYAALIAEPEASEEEFKKLSGFSYATRNATISFCQNLLIKKHQELAELIKCDPTGKNAILFSSYLINLDEFRGSFFSDPSIMSMMVVLNRIHIKFYGMNDIWQKLTSEDCPINFDMLDFGVFDLSDDLYNKMNSRGKPLTSFEIFKAKIHKRIGKHSKFGNKYANKIVISLDTKWIQFIWEALDYTEELKVIDSAYMNFFKHLFRTFDYISGRQRPQFKELDDEFIDSNMANSRRIEAMKFVFDTLVDGKDKIPEKLRNDYKSLIKEAVSANFQYNSILALYAIIIGLYKDLNNKEFFFRYRHVRNLINNSSYQIREKEMTNLLKDVENVMKGRLLKHNDPKLSEGSWKEEQEKERNRAVWESLYEYEDISEINATLSAFAVGLSEDDKLNLSDVTFVAALKERLDKAKYFFEVTGGWKREEHKRRSALLYFGDYSMAMTNRPAFRYFGIVTGSWRNFTGFHDFDDRNRIMETFDKIDTSLPIEECNLNNTYTEHWRYYTIKYADLITVAYQEWRYGYIYYPGVTYDKPFDETKGYLDAIALQSTYYSENNVAWKLIHRILELKISEKYYFYLDKFGGSSFILSKISNSVEMDMREDGWHILGILESKLTKMGFSVENYNIIKEQEDIEIYDCLIKHIEGRDFVEEGISIMEKLSNWYPVLLK
ncbi:MAG: DUF262 domain-containing protein [Fermentimonas sp.]|nr:DUF262 domain-containing protein [Fermentimonas sp.]